eukprot:gene8050-9902_t
MNNSPPPSLNRDISDLDQMIDPSYFKKRTNKFKKKKEEEQKQREKKKKSVRFKESVQFLDPSPQSSSLDSSTERTPDLNQIENDNNDETPNSSDTEDEKIVVKKEEQENSVDLNDGQVVKIKEEEEEYIDEESLNSIEPPSFSLSGSNNGELIFFSSEYQSISLPIWDAVTSQDPKIVMMIKGGQKDKRKRGISVPNYRKNQPEITIDDLMKAGFLMIGDRLSYSIAGATHHAILLRDAYIEYNYEKFPSVHSWIIHILSKLSPSKKYHWFSPWDSIFVKGKSLNHIRNVFESNFIDPNFKQPQLTRKDLDDNQDHKHNPTNNLIGFKRPLDQDEDDNNNNTTTTTTKTKPIGVDDDTDDEGETKMKTSPSPKKRLKSSPNKSSPNKSSPKDERQHKKQKPQHEEEDNEATQLISAMGVDTDQTQPMDPLAADLESSFENNANQPIPDSTLDLPKDEIEKMQFQDMDVSSFEKHSVLHQKQNQSQTPSLTDLLELYSPQKKKEQRTQISSSLNLDEDGSSQEEDKLNSSFDEKSRTALSKSKTPNSSPVSQQSSPLKNNSVPSSATKSPQKNIVEKSLSPQKQPTPSPSPSPSPQKQSQENLNKSPQKQPTPSPQKITPSPPQFQIPQSPQRPSPQSPPSSLSSNVKSPQSSQSSQFSQPLYQIPTSPLQSSLTSSIQQKASTPHQSPMPVSTSSASSSSKQQQQPIPTTSQDLQPYQIPKSQQPIPRQVSMEIDDELDQQQQQQNQKNEEPDQQQTIGEDEEEVKTFIQNGQQQQQHQEIIEEPQSPNSSQSVPTSTFKEPVILGTGLSSLMQLHILSLVNAIGGRFVNTFSKEVTHVWIDEKNYEIEGDEQIATGSPHRARLHLLYQTKRLFYGYSFYLADRFESPSKNEIISLIKEGGGILLSNKPPRPQNVKELLNSKCVVIVHPNFVDHSKANSIYLETKHHPISYKWICDCISSYSILPKEKYIVGFSDLNSSIQTQQSVSY